MWLSFKLLTVSDIVLADYMAAECTLTFSLTFTIEQAFSMRMNTISPPCGFVFSTIFYFEWSYRICDNCHWDTGENIAIPYGIISQMIEMWCTSPTARKHRFKMTISSQLIYYQTILIQPGPWLSNMILCMPTKIQHPFNNYIQHLSGWNAYGDNKHWREKHCFKYAM